MTITLNSLQNKLFISILFCPFPKFLSCSFVQKVFLCLLILPNSLCLFICIRYWFGQKLPLSFSVRCYRKTQRNFLTNPTYQLCFLVLKKWPYVEGVLLSPVWQCSLVPRARCSRAVSCACCMCPPVVAGPWLLNGWVKFAPRPAGCEAQPPLLQIHWHTGSVPLRGSFFGGALLLTGVICCVELGGSHFLEASQ